MVDGLADLLERVVPEPRVDLRGDIGGEVAQRRAREELAQVDGQEHLDGLSPPPLRHLFALQLIDRLHHRRAQQLRHRHAEALGALAQRVRRDHHRHEVFKSVWLRCAAEVPGRRLAAARLHIPGIAQEAVLELLLVRLLEPSEHTLLRRDGQAVLLTEVLGQQRLEEDQPARAVRQRVEKLHGDPVVIHQHAQRAPAHLIERRVCQRAALLRLDLRCLRDLFEIVPEHAPAQPHGDRREAPYRHVQRRAQHVRIHRLRQRRGQAEEIRPVAALGRGIDLRGVVEPHPAQALRRGEHLREKAVELAEVLLHVLAEVIEHIRMPALGRDEHPALASAREEFFVQAARVVEHDLVPADKQQRRRQPLQIPEQGRAQRVARVVRIAPGVELQQLLRHGGIGLAVCLICLARLGEIRPRRDADQAARQGKPQLAQLQT